MDWQNSDGRKLSLLSDLSSGIKKLEKVKREVKLCDVYLAFVSEGEGEVYCTPLDQGMDIIVSGLSVDADAREVPRDVDSVHVYAFEGKCPECGVYHDQA